MSGAASMRALERQLAKVPDEAVAELVRWFIPRSEEIGGKIKMGGRRYQLTSRLRNPKQGRGSASVIVAGSPAGAWAIKSYGRRGGYTVKPRRRKALHLGASSNVFFASVHVGSGTSGDRRWDRLVQEANEKFPDVVADLVDRVVKV
jgi:hypothetical protein